MSSVRHLVSVWNPSYDDDAMEEHLRVLREWARRHAAGEADADDVYVWWGKVKSPNRQAPMPHLPEVCAVGGQGEDDEVHLYLTDYRSLYVADVLDVSSDALAADEVAHAPAYYERKDLRCDVWFRLADIRRLVVDDTLAVVEELKKLRNLHYNERPVSIYGGMVNLPLVVTRHDGASFFDGAQRDLVTGDRLWAEFDAELGAGIAAMERDLRENRFGQMLWQALEPVSRVFIASGERVYREHRADPAFDFALVVMNFAKAMEVEANALLRRALPKLSGAERLVSTGQGMTQVLGEGPPLSLGQLARAVGGERELHQGLTRVMGTERWFVESFPSIADELAEVRNRAAHGGAIDRAAAARWRDRMVGVGCEGDFVAIGRAKARVG